MIRFNVGETQVIPLLLPGMVLTSGLTAVTLVRSRSNLATQFESLADSFAVDTGALGAMVVTAAAISLVAFYVVSMIGAAMLAIVGGYAEYQIFDRYRASRLKLSMEEYWDQWQRYLKDIEDHRNSYISNFVDLYLFIHRLWIAVAIVSFSALVFCDLAIWLPLLGFAFAIGGFLVAAHYHQGLAEFRNQRFAKATSNEKDEPDEAA